MSSTDGSPIRNSFFGYGDRAPYGVESLVGETAIELDGASLILPESVVEQDFTDDLSSINSSTCRQNARPVRGGASQDIEVGLRNNKRQGTTKTLQEQTCTLPSEIPPTRTGGLPLWITRAPLCAKVIALSSTAALVGSVVLVAVAVTFAYVSLEEQQSAVNNGASASEAYPQSHTFPPYASAPWTKTLFPTPTPVKLPSNGTENTTSPVLKSPSPVPMVAPVGTPPTTPTHAPSELKSVLDLTNIPSAYPSAEAVIPSVEPSHEASLEPTRVASSAPTSTPDESVITFYAVSGRFQGNSLEPAVQGLAHIPTDHDSAFLVQLGDWNDPFSGCSKEAFESVGKLYATSSIPVYFVTGRNEYTGKCERSLGVS